MKFGPGNPGRPKGAKDKTTTAAKELFMNIMEGEVDHIKQSLTELRKKDKAKYLDTLSKFFPYFIPKRIEIDTPKEMVIHVKRRS